jgi:hypothetical protein
MRKRSAPHRHFESVILCGAFVGLCGGEAEDVGQEFVLPLAREARNVQTHVSQWSSHLFTPPVLSI